MTTTATADEATDHLTAGRAKFSEAMRSLTGGFNDNPQRFISAFIGFFLSLCYRFYWTVSNIRKTNVGHVSEMIGTGILMIFTAIMLPFGLMIVCVRWILSINTWKLFKDTVKLGCIVLLCILLYNWGDSVVVGSDGKSAVLVEQGISSVCKSGVMAVGQSLYNCSDAGKKALLFHEIEGLLAREERVSKTLGQQIGWAYQGISSPKLLLIQIRQGRVGFEQFREELEEAVYRTALLVELAKQAPEDCRRKFDLSLYQCEDVKPDIDDGLSDVIRIARDQSDELHDRINKPVAF